MVRYSPAELRRAFAGYASPDAVACVPAAEFARSSAGEACAARKGTDLGGNRGAWPDGGCSADTCASLGVASSAAMATLARRPARAILRGAPQTRRGPALLGARGTLERRAPCGQPGIGLPHHPRALVDHPPPLSRVIARSPQTPLRSARTSVLRCRNPVTRAWEQSLPPLPNALGRA